MCKYFSKKDEKNFAECHKFYNFADHKTNIQPIYYA